jgi:rare lipoprotein A
MKNSILLLALCVLCGQLPAQDRAPAEKPAADSAGVKKANVYFGTASFYAEKFNGRKTANGEIYNSQKFTAACNVLPLGTWIRVTNLRNKKSVIVKTNDRLHVKMKRVVDLSYAAAEKLGYTRRGLTQVKVEVLGKRPG